MAQIPHKGQANLNGNGASNGAAFFDNYSPAAPQQNLLEVSPPPSPVPKVAAAVRQDSNASVLFESPAYQTGVNPFRPRNNSTETITPKTSDKAKNQMDDVFNDGKKDGRGKDKNVQKDPIPHHDEGNHPVRVFEEFKPEWKLLQDSFKQQKDGIYKEFYNAIEKLKKLEKNFETAQDEFYRKMQVEYEKISDDLSKKHKQLEDEREKFSREKDQMKDIVKFQNERVKLSVGGTVIETSLNTLRRDHNSKLASIFSGHHEIKRDADGCYFIDRDGTHFRQILNFLRDGRIPPGIDSKIIDEVIQEAQYYEIAGLSKLKWANLPRVSQEALNNMYPLRHGQTSVIFNFNRQDLSGLNFVGYIIDPKSKFVGCDLDNADFENTGFGFDFKFCVDFSNANLMGAKFPPSGTRLRQQGVRFNLTDARIDETQSLT